MTYCPSLCVKIRTASSPRPSSRRASTSAPSSLTTASRPRFRLKVNHGSHPSASAALDCACRRPASLHCAWRMPALPCALPLGHGRLAPAALHAWSACFSFALALVGQLRSKSFQLLDLYVVRATREGQWQVVMPVKKGRRTAGCKRRRAEKQTRGDRIRGSTRFLASQFLFFSKNRELLEIDFF